MKAFIVSLLFLPLILFGQLNDNFTDGDFINNPTWQGDIPLFKVNSSLQLQLNQLNPRPDLADTSYLSSPFGMTDSLEWNFSIRLAFSPSDNNNARVYLMVDKSDLTQDLNGYFLQFGELLSEDAIELFKQQGSQIESICRGTNAKIAAGIDANIKVIYKEDASWSVLVDWNKNGNYIPECNGQNQSEISNPYFGFFCKYTSSNATKFYFDNVNVNHIYIDKVAPEVMDIKTISKNQLLVKFNEVLDVSSAENAENYQIQQSNQRPEFASLNNTNPSEVLLTFAIDFPANQGQTLLINSIKDLAGNTLESTSFDFFFSRAEYGDVLINEIMPDPSPVQGLPDAEYLELYNRANYPVQLNNWRLQIGSSSFRFPEITIPEKGFLILTHPNNLNLLNNYGEALAVPSFVLANSGTSILLKNNVEQLIHYIKYDDKWYNDDFKAEGGWSLEMISADHFCEQSINWAASQNSKGGSPGASNSLNNLNPDYPSPQIEAVDVLNQNILLLHFSKSMDTLVLKNPQNYSADNSLGSPSTVKVFAPEYRLAEISFANLFTENTIYQLSIDQSLIGCCGSELQNPIKRFALPQVAEFGDLVINEILFNPWIDDGEYVELYNRSNKVIDSRQLVFSRIVPDVYDTTWYSIQPNAGLFFPEEYLLLCKNKASVLDVYFSENPEVFNAFDNFPILPNTEGQLLLSKASNKSSLIDAFNYHEDMHHPLLNSTRGIALERLSPEGLTNDLKNWQSASSSVNYGTPGYQNSQFQAEATIEDIIQIFPEIFSPDLDGFDDILQINYLFSQSGYTLNLIIFNSLGQRIRHLVKNELVGISGQIFWDGTTEEGDRASLGVYILYFEYFDLNGKIEKMKRTCVLGGKL